MICPICKKELSISNKSYKCSNNHSFDIAKEGYLNLLISKKNSGDTKESTLARLEFLEKGYYDFLGNELNKIISNISASLDILDLGCGVGYYDKFIPSKSLVGLDISKYAIQKAAKHNKNHFYLVASSANIPYQDHSFDLIFSIFSPIFIDEIKRVLKPNGILITVTPGTNHLFELKQRLYTNPYLNEEENITYPDFDCDSMTIKNQVILDSIDIDNLIKMTPYYYKTNSDDIKMIKKDSFTITFEFCINIYKLKY